VSASKTVSRGGVPVLNPPPLKNIAQPVKNNKMHIYILDEYFITTLPEQNPGYAHERMECYSAKQFLKIT
jgi:hypothetical protein